MDYVAPKIIVTIGTVKPAKTVEARPEKAEKKSFKSTAASWGSAGAHRVWQKVDLSEIHRYCGAFTSSPSLYFVKRLPRQRGAARRRAEPVEKELSDKILSDDELLSMIFQRVMGRPHFAAEVMEAVANSKKTAPSEPAISLPIKAPRLWTERPDNERWTNPAAWIRLVYAPWLGQGLARHHVGELDPALGKAYSSWTRKERHPEDIIQEFAEGNPYGRLDDKEALRRRRTSSIESRTRGRAAKMPQP